MDIVAQQIFNGFSAGMSYALIALGLTLVFGVLHVINFAHGELYMIGGLSAVALGSIAGVPYLMTIPLAAIAAGAVAFVVDKAAVSPVIERTDGGGSALLGTFACSILILESVLWLQGPAPVRIDGVPGAIHLGPVTITMQRIAIISFGLLLLLAIRHFLLRTSVGRDLRAVAQDGLAARVIGVDVERVRSITFVVAAAVAGFAGALMVPIVLFTPMMGQHVVIKAFVVVVIGGMGSVSGAIIAGLALGLIEVLLRGFVMDGIAQAMIYSLLIVMLLVRPQGLFKATR
jgi:branched-chain amino acid transport system permease protein